MTSLRALVRLARRDARRDRWRTLLVVVLVALPVAGLGGSVALVDTLKATPEERVRDELGRADAAAIPLSSLPDADPREALAAMLPADAIVERHQDAADGFVRDGRRFEVGVSDRSLREESLSQRYRLLDGRAPVSPDEIAATAALAEELDLAIGDVLPLDGRGDATVVGLVRRPEFLDDRTLLLAPGTIREPLVTEFLIDLPVGVGPEVLAPLAETDATGVPYWSVIDREQELSYRLSRGERWTAIVIGGLAVVEVALIAGAAFAVSVRRRQRELGLLAAVGGTRRDVRRVVLLTGVTAGAVGALLGTLLSIGGMVAASPWLDALAGREITRLRLDPVWLAGVAGIGILSAALGAWWPARSVAALPVTVALSGRRPPPQLSVRGLRAGVLVGVAGAGVTLGGSVLLQDPFVFLLGSVLVVLGAGLTSPWLLEQVGRTAPRLPAGPRLAIRDAARFRTRNGPIVTAAMAGLAATISVATVVGSIDASDSAAYTPSLATDQLLVHSGGEAASRAVANATGGELAMVSYPNLTARYPTADDDASDGGDGGGVPLTGSVAIGTPELARALGGSAAEQALSEGTVVLFGHETARVELVSSDTPEGRPATVERALGGFDVLSLPLEGDVPADSAQVPTILIPVGLVEVASPPDSGLVTLAEPIDDATYGRATQAAASAAGGSGLPGEAYVLAERGYRSAYAGTLIVVLVSGALAGLLVVGVAVALAAAEARSDLRTLTAVGASGRTRRSLAAGRAALLAGLGGILAVPVGLVPGAAILGQIDDVSFAVPWSAIVTALVIVPLVATLGSVLASGRSPTPSVRGTA